jgi:hypothetical protein
VLQREGFFSCRGQFKRCEGDGKQAVTISGLVLEEVLAGIPQMIPELR